MAAGNAFRGFSILSLLRNECPASPRQSQSETCWGLCTGESRSIIAWRGVEVGGAGSEGHEGGTKLPP